MYGGEWRDLVSLRIRQKINDVVRLDDWKVR
jgi:hypothetical protein